MRIVLKTFIALLLAAGSHYTSAQTVLDSLKHVVATAKEDTTRVRTQNELARKYFNMGNLDSSLLYSTSALEQAEKLRTSKPSPQIDHALLRETARSFLIIGAIHYYRSEHDLALEYYLKSAKIKKSIGDSAGLSMVFNNMGNIYLEKSDYNKSREYYLKSLHIAESLHDTKSTADINNNIGIIYQNQTDYPKALEYFFRALQYYESEKLQKEIGLAHANIGTVYMEQRFFDKALEHFLKGLKAYEKSGDKTGLASSYNNVGIVYLEQRNFSKALEYHFRARQLREEIGERNNIATSYNNIGSVYTTFYKADKLKTDISFNGPHGTVTIPYHLIPDSALALHEKALKLNRETKGYFRIHHSLLGTGTALRLKGKYKEAAALYKEAYEVAVELGILKHKMEAANLLYEVHHEMNDPAAALQWHEKYMVYKDSIFNQEVNKKSVQAEMNFEFEKKEALARAEQEKKDLISQAQIRQERLQRNGFIAAFVLMLILALVSYRNFRNKKAAHAIIEQQKALVAQKNKDILDSINYAKNIQQAILPFEHRIGASLHDYFILFKPRDIVSGDFYWFTEKDNYLFIAAADCTGHGVPGAFMSMIGSATLTSAVTEQHLLDPGEILSELNRKIKQALKQTENSNRDGMDISILRFEKNNLCNAVYASAMRTLYCIREELSELRGDKMPIGGTTPDDFVYTSHTLSLCKGDRLYIFSDGYTDQFGGKDGKKFRTGNFKNLLLSISLESMSSQKKVLSDTFEEWRKNLEQTDDVCVIGIRV